jgi:MFS family permease
MDAAAALARRVLVFSSIGHALMHMMTAFYAVIVLTLAIAWDLPPERLLELYAPAAILLGVMSLPAGWASDRFGAPLMMVVMFAGLGLSSIACGLVAERDTLSLMLALCGLGIFGAGRPVGLDRPGRAVAAGRRSRPRTGPRTSSASGIARPTWSLWPPCRRVAQDSGRAMRRRWETARSRT